MKEPHVELRVWRQFVTLAEELHFGRAAARLHMTQPPLTQAIAQLEQTLGVRLFDRTRRSVRLTEAARAVLPDARELLERAASLPRRAQAAAAGETGLLRLAFVSTAGFDLLPAWVRAFRQRCPGVTLELVEATGDVQQQAFERGEIDAGFMLHSPGFAPEGMASQVVAVEPWVLALAEGHPLLSGAARREGGRLELAAVLAEPLVIFPRRILPSPHDAIFGLYHANGHSPQVVQEAIQMQTIVNLVSAGLGVAWVPRSVTQFQRPGVAYRTVRWPAGQTPLEGQTSLWWRQDRHNPVLARFIESAPVPLPADSLGL